MVAVDPSEVERYLRIYQENPDSRVFAPLADLYRRMGRLREAEEICREGLQRHPYYAGGKVALAHILLDSDRLEEALREAEGVVTYYPDNLLARKLLIRVLGGLNRTKDARREFEALKHLAPLVAGDPELERALQGRARMETLPRTPIDNPVVPQGVFKPIQIQERTDWDDATAAPGIRESYISERLSETMPAAAGPSPAEERSRRLSRLLRKKVVLEGLIQRLGTP